MIRACASAMRTMSPRLIPKAVGFPVVPDVPWTRASSRFGTHRLLPKGGYSAWSSRISSFITQGM